MNAENGTDLALMGGEIRSLTGLRGVAAVLVLAHHANLAASGPNGALLPGQILVDLFFALSGYVLARSTSLNRVSWRQFALARFARLYPLHLLTTLVLITVASATGEHPEWLSATQVIAEATFTMALPLFGTGQAVNHVSWSVAVEWWTYFLVLPALLLACRFASARMLMLGSASAAILLVSALYGAANPIAGWLALARAVVGFAGGFAAYRWNDVGAPILTDGRTDALAMVALLGAFAVPAMARGEAWFLLPVLPLIVAGLAKPDGGSICGRLLTSAGCVALGRISYGLYLLHPLAITAVRRAAPEVIGGSTLGTFACTLALTVPAAALAFKWVERPCTDWMRVRAAKRHDTARPLNPILEVA
jgi:peptidoglycan/LPS O-acetylase OafA/YrhL